MDNSDSTGYFVVPKDRPFVSGWWVGEILKEENESYQISVLWNEIPEYGCYNFLCLPREFVLRFESEAEAMEHVTNNSVFVYKGEQNGCL